MRIPWLKSSIGESIVKETGFFFDILCRNRVSGLRLITIALIFAQKPLFCLIRLFPSYQVGSKDRLIVISSLLAGTAVIQAQITGPFSISTSQA